MEANRNPAYDAAKGALFISLPGPIANMALGSISSLATAILGVAIILLVVWFESRVALINYLADVRRKLAYFLLGLFCLSVYLTSVGLDSGEIVWSSDLPSGEVLRVAALAVTVAVSLGLVLTARRADG